MSQRELQLSMINIPLSLIESFFINNHLHEAKATLREVHEHLIQKNYPYETGSIDDDNIRFFFKKIEELMDAAYLINAANIPGDNEFFFKENEIV